jgi:hypothetical protein
LPKRGCCWIVSGGNICGCKLERMEWQFRMMCVRFSGGDPELFRSLYQDSSPALIFAKKKIANRNRASFGNLSWWVYTEYLVSYNLAQWSEWGE